MLGRSLGIGALALLVVSCGGDERREIRMKHPRGDFYDAPFPAADLVAADGTVDLGGFPNPGRIAFIDDLVGMVDGVATGFGTTSGVFFSSRVALDPAALPTVQGSVDPAASVFLIGIEPGSPDYLERYPVVVEVEDDGGPFGAANMLSVVPLQGVPLRPNRLYAAVVLRSVGDGEPLDQARAVEKLAAGDAAYPELADAAAALSEAGLSLGDVAALTAFRTQDAAAELDRFVDHARGMTAPAPNAAFARTDLFADYCVYQTTVDMPVYQQGQPPFTNGGGDWPADPVVQVMEEARLVVTIPRAAAPAGGFPVAVMSRTGGGGDRPLVDRGRRAESGGQAIEPGSGPALQFARAGFAGVTIDGPHGGLRNITDGDEQFLIFNISNPAAIRDNIRQSALELALVPYILDGVTIDISDCPDASASGELLDTSLMALMGHSMGATIAPLVLAAEPRYGAAILSGAGGSWIENIVHKQSPFEIKPIATSLLGYADLGRELRERDPALSLFQWAVEAADPPIYGRAIIREASEPRHVLMLQGIVDTYILPPIANATSLSIGLDLAGPELDRGNAELSEFTPIADLLPLVGRGRIELPATGNIEVGGQSVTGVVVQHPEDSVEDGHEVVFQTDPPKTQYEELLRSWRSGTPVVPVP